MNVLPPPGKVQHVGLWGAPEVTPLSPTLTMGSPPGSSAWVRMLCQLESPSSL